MKLTVARFSGHSSRGRNIVSGSTILHFRTWIPNFIVVSQGINKNLAAQLRERAPLRSQWSALPVNPSWVPGSCFRWSQRLATLAIRGVMPFSGLFEHCTQSQTHTQPRIRKILEICTYSSCQTLIENIPPPLPCTQAPGSETQTGQKNSLYP